MEVELKYTAQDAAVLEGIWQDAWLGQYTDDSTREEEEYDAVYYDTADLRLLHRDIAYRIRREGERYVACLKWNGEADGPLHRREELNITLPEGKVAPDLSVFQESEIGPSLLELVGETPLEPLMQVQVTRRSVKIDTGREQEAGSILEVSLDLGRILAKTQPGDDAGAHWEEPVCELEIELYSGRQQDLLDVGHELEARYDITPESRSKFSRGLALRGITRGPA